MDKNMEGFIKKTESGEVLFAPNFVLTQNYELYAENHEDYNYPVDGWEWTENYEPQNDPTNENTTV